MCSPEGVTHMHRIYVDILHDPNIQKLLFKLHDRRQPRMTSCWFDNLFYQVLSQHHPIPRRTQSDERTEREFLHESKTRQLQSRRLLSEHTHVTCKG
jgi:hypothetical protein